jgi:hypothetical protein
MAHGCKVMFTDRLRGCKMMLRGFKVVLTARLRGAW